jgi:hypothetical protein
MRTLFTIRAIINDAFVALLGDLSQMTWVNLTKRTELSVMASNRKTHETLYIE